MEANSLTKNKNIMKKLKIFILLLIYFLALILLGLAHSEGKPSGPEYYPLKEGHRWTYIVSRVDGKGKKFTQEVTVPGKDKYKGKEYIILQQKDKRGKVRSFCIKDNTGVYWKRLSGTSKFLVGGSSVFTKPIPILQFPLTVGTKWDWEGTLKVPLFVDKKIKMRCRVVAEEEIKVPAGTFRCLKIHIHQLRNKEVSDEYGWYAPGIGQIKYIGKELEKELMSYSLVK